MLIRIIFKEKLIKKNPEFFSESAVELFRSYIIYSSNNLKMSSNGILNKALKIAIYRDELISTRFFGL